MIIQPKSLSEITKEVIAILCREIGIANTLRFVNQFTTGHGNYTEERGQLFADMTLNDIVSEIRRTRGRQNGI